jgi:hypothetical protein
MTAKLSAVRTGRAQFPETLPLCFRYSFLLMADYTPGPCESGRIRWIGRFPSAGLETATFRLLAHCLNHYCENTSEFVETAPIQVLPTAGVWRLVAVPLYRPYTCKYNWDDQSLGPKCRDVVLWTAGSMSWHGRQGWETVNPGPWRDSVPTITALARPNTTHGSKTDYSAI